MYPLLLNTHCGKGRRGNRGSPAENMPFRIGLHAFPIRCHGQNVESPNEGETFCELRNFQLSFVFLSPNNPENSRENDYPPMRNSPLCIGGIFFASALLLDVCGWILAARVNVVVDHSLQRALVQREREAALDAAAAGDGEGVLVHAARAVGEYRGDFLPGVYEDWLLEARSELERWYVEVCDLLCQVRAGRGDVAGAADAARRRIRVRPLEEGGYRTLMQLQADLGDRAGAVSTFHHCASVLERELGIVPDRATRQVFRRLLVADDPAGAAAAAAIEPAVRRSGFAAARLVGRSGELGLLQEVWEAAVAAGPVLRWSVVVPGWGRPAWSPRSPRWHGGGTPWWPAASVSGHRPGWRLRRWRTGCGIRRCGQRRRRLTRSGAPKLTGWCPLRAARNGGLARKQRPARGQWRALGSVIASSRASRGRCLRWGAR